MVKVNIIFHSVYGHLYEMAKAIAAGAASVPDVEVTIKQVEETLPKSILKEMNGYESKQLLQHIPIAAVEDLVENYEDLEQDFTTFFDDLINFTQQKTKLLSTTNE